MTHRFLVKWQRDDRKYIARGRCDLDGRGATEARQWVLGQVGALGADVAKFEIVSVDSPRAPWWRRWFGGAA